MKTKLFKLIERNSANIEESEKNGIIAHHLEVDDLIDDLVKLFAIPDVSGSAFDCLKNIANPLNYLQEQADKDGCKLNGQMAVDLCDDANYLRGLANNFLARH